MGEDVRIRVRVIPMFDPVVVGVFAAGLYVTFQTKPGREPRPLPFAAELVSLKLYSNATLKLNRHAGFPHSLDIWPWGAPSTSSVAWRCISA